jgi:hypothetical protein
MAKAELTESNPSRNRPILILVMLAGHKAMFFKQAL